MSIKKLDDGRYMLDIRPDGRNGKRIRKAYTKKSLALAAERYYMAMAEKREFVSGYRDRRTLSDLLEEWWLLHGQHQKNADVERKCMEGIVAELGKNTVASTLTKKQIVVFRSKRLMSGSKPATINRYLARLSGMFSTLIKFGVYKASNPLHGLEYLHVPPSEMTFLTKSEIAKLLNVLEGDYRKIAVICLSTGARFGEAARLRGEHVFYNRIVFTQTKNGKTRVVPISEEVFREIKTRESGPLFSVSYMAFRYLIRKINPDLPDGQATHVLRHTFASHFCMNGGNIVALQKILGHSNIQQTMTYAHLSPDYLQDAVSLNPLNGGVSIDHALSTLK